MSKRRQSVTSQQIGLLFSACDLDGSGFIDESELASICPDISREDLREVFHELDKDGDGRISIVEFADGYKGIRQKLIAISRRKRREKLSASQEDLLSSGQDLIASTESTTQNVNLIEDDGDAVKDTAEFVETIDDGFAALSCQEQVCELYQQLHATELPTLLNQFETIILAVIKDIRQYQLENERLENSYKRDKEQHENHLRHLEEEMEAQMQRVEKKVRKEERAKSEAEKEELKKQLEAEVSELQSNLKRLQKLDSQIARGPSDEQRTRIDELTQENRFLKRNLTEAQTNLTLLRSEFTTLRQQFEEKCYELENEKETLVEYIKEQDNLTRQVHLLHDANKKLNDTNDDLRSAIEKSRIAQKRSYPSDGGQPHSRGQSIQPSAYVQEYMSTPTSRLVRSPSTLADELVESQRGQLLPNQDSCEMDSHPDDMDSGHHSTMRDGQDSEYEPHSLSDEVSPRQPRRKNRRCARGTSTDYSTTESEMEHRESDEDTEVELDRDEVDGPLVRRPQTTVKRRLPTIPSQIAITGEPERMYKVVLAGDAAVGKSSFIMRLCKGKFFTNLQSTLGVDFQTKTICVDGRIIALQLWDTAGQERFRSIAKSYFRRADGVLLLYDTTYERSFINVRDWVESIEDGAQKKIPIMLCGNKVDLRDKYSAEGKKGLVSTEDGARLSKDFESLFIETSAKDGDNIEEAVIELARLLRTTEDIEVKNVGMKLHESMADKKKSGCCSL